MPQSPRTCLQIVWFYLTKSPKPKVIQFTVIYDKVNHQILTFEKVEPQNI